MGKAREKKFIVGLHLILGGLLFLYSIAAFFSVLRGGEFSYSYLFFPAFVEMLLLALGVLMIKGSVTIKGDHKLVDFVIGIFLFFFGILPIATALGLSYVLPFTLDLEPSMIVLVVVLFFSSLYFLVDRYIGLNNHA